MPEPAYEIQSVRSRVTTGLKWDGYEPVWKAIGEGSVVLWQHHLVFTGVIENGTVRWLNKEAPASDEDHLVRLRAFNEILEFHFWRDRETIQGRMREDGVEHGEETAYIDTEMILRGAIAEPLQEEEKDKTTFWLQSRNYIDYHTETFQAGYVDCRFVAFF